MTRAITTLLAAAFLAFAGLKIATGHHQALAMSKPWFYSVAVIELLTAALLVSRWRVLGLWATVGFVAIACGAAFVWRDRPCGCFGSAVELDWRWRIVLLSALGALASLTLQWHLSNRETSSAGSTTAEDN